MKNKTLKLQFSLSNKFCKPAWARLVEMICVTSVVTFAWTAGTVRVQGQVFKETFESLTPNTTINGQNGWVVSKLGGAALNTSLASVSNNPAIAFQGLQYLTMTGQASPTHETLATHSLFDAPFANGNVFSYAVRWDATGPGGAEGITTEFLANGGTTGYKTEFRSNGGIRVYTNGSAFFNTAALISSNQWYLVRYDASYSASDIRLRVNKASDNSSVLDTIIPYNVYGGTPTNLYQIVFHTGADSKLQWSFDNISVIPEPSTLSFLAAGGMLWLRLASRGRR